jgi:predicted GNAT family acetyltransferase
VTEEVLVNHDPEAKRYVIDADGGRVGFLSYRPAGDNEVALLHTEIDPTVERRGLGSQLVHFALEDARGRGLSVLPYCPFVRHYIVEHPEFRDAVPEDRRARFGL